MNDSLYISADHESLAAHIEKKRGGMKAQEFAEYLGTTRQQVDQWKKGLAMPRPAIIEKLGLRPCYEVVDPTPFQEESPEPLPKTREDLLSETVRLQKQIDRLQKEVEALKAGKKPGKKA